MTLILCDECGKLITGLFIYDAKVDDGEKYCSHTFAFASGVGISCLGLGIYWLVKRKKKV